MRKTVLAVITVLICVPVLAADIIAPFTEFRLSYAGIAGPASLAEDAADGLYDTACLDIKAGADVLDWASVYAGLGFGLFVGRADVKAHYTFYPLYAGMSVNLFPDWPVFPSLYAEAGASLSNRRYAEGPAYKDAPWTGFYYNFGASVSVKLSEKLFLLSGIDRPSYGLDPRGEIHALRLSLGMKGGY